MPITERLYDEHRVIERVLDALETAAGRLEGGGPVRPGFFLDAADFVSGFADGCHHRKEEDVLFKAMITHGAPVDGGAIAMMLDEHVQGRQLNRAMREGARRLADGDAMARAQISSAARTYVALLRDHIAKEDEMLFPMAEELIPASAAAGVIDAMDRTDQGDGDAHARYLALAEQLEQEIRA